MARKKKKQKWYVVWKGRVPGIYTSWDECAAQVQGFPAAQYKSYESALIAQKLFESAWYVVWHGRETGVFHGWGVTRPLVENRPDAEYRAFFNEKEAWEAFSDEEGIDEKRKAPKVKSKLLPDAVAGQQIALLENPPIADSLAVDAACSGNPGLLEYRGVWTKSKEQLFHRGPFVHGTNNIGEFLALVHGLSLLQRQGSDMPIYSDSKIAIGWVKGKWCRTNLEETADNGDLFILIDRAEQWLKTNSYKTKILKWDTAAWGEIPADFGRK